MSAVVVFVIVAVAVVALLVASVYAAYRFQQALADVEAAMRENDGE